MPCASVDMVAEMGWVGAHMTSLTEVMWTARGFGSVRCLLKVPEGPVGSSTPRDIT